MTKENIDTYIRLLMQYNIKSVSIVDKKNGLSNLDVATQLLNESDFDITLHYSLQYHYNRSLDVMHDYLNKYLENSKTLGINKFLVVSGGVERKNTSVEILALYEAKRDYKLYCAFNPYVQNLDLEIARLGNKSQYVDGVYLQIGEDIEILDNVLKREDVRNSLRGKDLYGCLLYPSRKIRSSLSFRSWKGVLFSNQYLQNEQYSRQVFDKYRAFYKSNGITPLAEATPFREEIVQNFL